MNNVYLVGLLGQTTNSNMFLDKWINDLDYINSIIQSSKKDSIQVSDIIPT